MPPQKKSKACPQCAYIKSDGKACKNQSLCNEGFIHCRVHRDKSVGQDLAASLANAITEKEELLEAKVVLTEVITALQDEVETVNDHLQQRSETHRETTERLAHLQSELTKRTRDHELVTVALNEASHKLQIWESRARQAVAAQGVPGALQLTDNELLWTLTDVIPAQHQRSLAFVSDVTGLKTNDFPNESAFLDAAFNKRPCEIMKRDCLMEPLLEDDWCSVPPERRFGPDYDGRCFDFHELGNMIESGLTYIGEYTFGGAEDPSRTRVFSRKAKIPADLNNVPFTKKELTFFHKKFKELGILGRFPVFDAFMKDL